MSLIKCPECNKDISNQAQICPNCGFDIASYIKNIDNKEKKKKRIKELIKTIQPPEKPKKPKPLNNAKHIIIEIIASILLIFSIWGFFFTYSIFDNYIIFMLLGISSFCMSCVIFSYSIGERNRNKVNIEFYNKLLAQYKKSYNEYIENPCKYKIKKAKKIYEIEERKQEFQKKLSNKQQVANQSNIPKCPTCQSINIQKISVTYKIVNTTMFGIAGTKRHKTFHCNNCGYEW